MPESALSDVRHLIDEYQRGQANLLQELTLKRRAAKRSTDPERPTIASRLRLSFELPSSDDEEMPQIRQVLSIATLPGQSPEFTVEWADGFQSKIGHDELRRIAPIQYLAFLEKLTI
jgi:hypothetical protein